MSESTDNLERVKERIRKLLNLAHDPAAMKGEIDNALRFANMMLLKHNLSEDEVRADAEPKGVDEIAAAVEATEYAQETFNLNAPRVTVWETILGGAIMDLVGTVSWYSCHGTVTKRNEHGVVVISEYTGKPMESKQVVFYGPAEDVAGVKALMHEWSQTIIALARLKYGNVLKNEGRAYAEGFAGALREAVAKIKREEAERTRQLESGGRLDVAQLATGTLEVKAMVLAERGDVLNLKNAQAMVLAKKLKARDWLTKSQGIKLGHRYNSYQGAHHGEARSAGHADGSRASGGFRYSRKPKLGGGS